MSGPYPTDAGAALACWPNEPLSGESSVGVAADPVRPLPRGVPNRSRDSAVTDFVRTPFALRCNVVKVWRPLPENIWNHLASPAAVLQSRQREQRALLSVMLMAATLIAGFSSFGYRRHVQGTMVNFPILGRSLASS